MFQIVNSQSTGGSVEELLFKDTQSTGLDDVLMYDWHGVDKSGWAQKVAVNWNEWR